MMVARDIALAKRYRLAGATGVFLLALSGAVAATPADPVSAGTIYEGSITSTATQCSDPLDDGTFGGTLRVTVSSVDNASGAVVLSIETSALGGNDGSGSTEGTLFSNNSVSLFNGLLTETDGTITNFSGSGVLTSTSTSGTVSGSDSLSCMVSASFSASAVTGNLSNTAVVPQTSVLTPAQQLTAVRGISTDIGRRVGFMRNYLTGNGENRALRGYAGNFGFQKAGLSAGDGAFRWGAWASASYTDSDDDFTAAASDSKRVSFMGGADFAPWQDNVLFGAALGFEHTDADTAFNGGEQTVNGLTIAPYVAAFWGEHFGADLTIGYTDMRIDQFRTVAGTRISSDPESERWFAAANFNYIRTHGAWVLGGRGGLLFARDRIDGFTESNGAAVAGTSFKLGQAQLGLDAAYRWRDGWEPFGSLVYEYDFSKTDLRQRGLNRDVDDSGFVLGLGMRYFGDGGTSGLIQLTSVLGRNNIDEYSIGATIRTDF
jgi:hypothetical protein